MTTGSKLKAVGVHIFAGGFTHGVLDAGFDVIAQLETGTFGYATSKTNHPHVPVFTPKTAWNLPKLARDHGPIDFVYANPPCAPWSAAGMSKKENRGYAAQSYRKDARVKCVGDVYDVIKGLRPRIAVWESVARLATNGRAFLEELSAEMRPLGYSTTLVLDDMVNAGLPQHRKRVFVCVHRIEFHPMPGQHPWVSTREALDGVTYDPETDLDGVSPLHMDLLKNTPQGKKLFVTYNKVNDADYEKGVIAHGRPPFLYRRLAWDTPSYTVTGGPHLFHPDEQRKLSVPEMAALCGYPRDYVFVGRLGDRYKQLAQCVTPMAGMWIAGQAELALQIDDNIEHSPHSDIRVYDYLKLVRQADAAAQVAMSLE